MLCNIYKELKTDAQKDNVDNFPIPKYFRTGFSELLPNIYKVQQWYDIKLGKYKDRHVKICCKKSCLKNKRHQTKTFTMNLAVLENVQLLSEFLDYKLPVICSLCLLKKEDEQSDTESEQESKAESESESESMDSQPSKK